MLNLIYAIGESRWGTYSNCGFPPLSLILEMPQKQVGYGQSSELNIKTVADTPEGIGKIKRHLRNTDVKHWKGEFTNRATNSRGSRSNEPEKQELTIILINILKGIQEGTGNIKQGQEVIKKNQ